MPLTFSRTPELLISGAVLSVSKWPYGVVTEMSLTLSIIHFAQKFRYFNSVLQFQLRDRNLLGANAAHNLRLQRSSDVLVDISIGLRK